jgi:phenylalanyl-tRNA synthetase beta chain
LNILVSHNWLKEYLSTQASPQRIAECLSLCGASVESLKKNTADWIFAIEVTTNRVDMMSVAGIARELAAILPQFGIKARLKTDPYQTFKLSEIKPESKKQLPIAIKDPDNLCHRILGVVLDEVHLGKSPQKIQDRLEKAGIRSLNNAVDITNYVMTEIGHPTHVFDYDRIKSHTLLLRRAKKGERIVSLEDKTYELPGGDIVIDDGTGQIIDLPGIIGTKNSIVTQDTKRVLFFIETNNPTQIRKTSMSLAIRTVAATLNEKSVDPELSAVALVRGVQLFKELTKAKVASKVHDLYPQPVKLKKLEVPLQFIEERLGVLLQPIKVKKILESLGFKTIYNLKTNSYKLVIPSWRAEDIAIAEDIVEEVARIYGYHNLPVQLPSGKLPSVPPDQPFVWEQRAKTALKHWGYTETYTYSLQSKALLRKFFLDPKHHLKLTNPLTKDWTRLRTSLLPSLLEVVVANRRADTLRLFELSKVYLPQQQGLPYEVQRLSLVTWGDFYEAKGVGEQLFREFNIPVAFEPHAQITQLEPHESALIKGKDLIIGFLGKLSQPVLTNFGLDRPVTILDLNFDKLVHLATPRRLYQPLPQYPPIIEHLTFANPGTILAGKIMAHIKSVSPLIASTRVIDTYENRLSFEVVYQSKTGSLTDDRVAKIRQNLVHHLERLGLQLQGKIQQSEDQATKD